MFDIIAIFWSLIGKSTIQNFQPKEYIRHITRTITVKAANVVTGGVADIFTQNKNLTSSFDVRYLSEINLDFVQTSHYNDTLSSKCIKRQMYIIVTLAYIYDGKLPLPWQFGKDKRSVYQIMTGPQF